MEINQIYQQAKALGVCDRFTGGETIGEVFELFGSPQGVEFFEKTGFPSLAIARSFNGVEARSAGVYIDAGEITLHGVAKAILMGATNAKLTFDDMAELRHEVIVMHGATAHVEASNWAVVFTQELGGTITKCVKDNAILK